VHKTQKGIAKLNSVNAEQATTIRRLQAELEVFKDAPARKRIKPNPNQRFSDIEQIQEAIAEAAQQEANNAIITIRLELEKASKDALEAGLQSMLFEFQLEL
jgi:PDZ domain-containing secreted protein